MKKTEPINAVITDFDFTLYNTRPLEPYKWCKERNDKLVKQLTASCTLYDGWSDTLLVLKWLGVPLGIVSHNVKGTIQQTLKATEVTVAFVLARYGRHFDYDNKRVVPKSELLKQALEEPCLHGIKKENVLYLGDTQYDVLESKRFGCQSGACFWDTDEPELLEQANPDYRLYTPTDIQTIVQ